MPLWSFTGSPAMSWVVVTLLAMGPRYCRVVSEYLSGRDNDPVAEPTARIPPPLSEGRGAGGYGNASLRSSEFRPWVRNNLAFWLANNVPDFRHEAVFSASHLLLLLRQRLVASIPIVDSTDNLGPWTACVTEGLRPIQAD